MRHKKKGPPRREAKAGRSKEHIAIRQMVFGAFMFAVAVFIFATLTAPPAVFDQIGMAHPKKEPNHVLR